MKIINDKDPSFRLNYVCNNVDVITQENTKALSGYGSDWMPPKCLPADYLRASLLACLLACLHACLNCLLAFLLACLLACLFSLLPCLLAYLLAFLLACRLLATCFPLACFDSHSQSSSLIFVIII